MGRSGAGWLASSGGRGRKAEPATGGSSAQGRFSRPSSTGSGAAAAWLMTGGRAACRGWCGSCTPRVEGRPEAGGGAGGGGAPAGCAANGQRSSHRVRPQKSWLRRAGGGSGARRTGHTGLQHSRQACRLDGQSNSTRCMPRDARRSTSCAGGRGLLRAAGLASCRSRLRWKLGLGADYRTHSLRARMFERTEPCARPRWSRPLPPPPASRLHSQAPAGLLHLRYFTALAAACTRDCST